MLAWTRERIAIMLESNLPGNVSPALARFADVLCMYELDLFSQQLKCVLAGPPSPLEERAIMFRLAEHAVHVCAVELLEAQDRKADAATLRCLAPITDQATARAAKLAADALESKSIGHARGAAHFAACDADDTGAPGRAAEHAAYAVAQTAGCYNDPEHARRVYDAAINLLTVLHVGVPQA
jgi:hypothetical protein